MIKPPGNRGLLENDNRCTRILNVKIPDLPDRPIAQRMNQGAP